MSLASGRRNLWPDRPEYRVKFVSCPKRVRAVFADRTVIDTTEARLMLESGHTPVYYFAPDALAADMLRSSDRTTFCPFKGDADYWHLVSGDRMAPNAVWSYRDPFPQKAEIRDWMALRWSAVDHWYEEDEEIFVHPRDPHVRIDVRRSSSPVRVRVGGQVVAESTSARFLFETGLPTRFYLPTADVRTDLLTPTESRTGCPYKGFARYWTLTLDGEAHPDLVWSYPEPYDEVRAIRDMLCFYEERVDAIEVDGVRRERPRAEWSPAE